MLQLAPGVPIELVSVPAGEFAMGSADDNAEADPNEKPRHAVYLDEYYIGKYEVTVAQFQAFVHATGHKTTAESAGWGYVWMGSSWGQVSSADWQDPQGSGTEVAGPDNHPVTQVSWDDAVAFCGWASQATGRSVNLPTEAQWERAARGTDARRYPWGDEAPSGLLLNYADRNVAVDWADQRQDDGYSFTAPVGSYPAGASPCGALDMAGNVWEWVADRYAEDYYDSSPRGNPTGPASGDLRVMRGGSWLNFDTYVRAATRDYGRAPDYRNQAFGFRVCLSPL
jgi:serine/threonine-protein kinase